MLKKEYCADCKIYKKKHNCRDKRCFDCCSNFKIKYILKITYCENYKKWVSKTIKTKICPKCGKYLSEYREGTSEDMFRCKYCKRIFDKEMMVVK